MLNAAPETLQDYVDNLDYNAWNTDDHPTFKAIIDGAAFIAIQASYCQLVCDLYEQTSPEVTYYFLTEVMGKNDTTVKAFINRLYTQFKKPHFNIQEGADLRSLLFSLCSDFREGRFTTVFGNRPTSSEEREITRAAIIFILNGMIDSFIPTPEIRNQFVIFSSIINGRAHNTLLDRDFEWQDKTMDMHQVLLKLVDSPVAHYQEFLALAKHIKDHNLTLDFQVVHYDFGNFESLPNSITDEQIRGEVQTVLNNLRTHQDRRYQPMPAPLAAAIAPGALPHGAAHLAAVHHAHDRSCTAKILLPFQLCYNAVSTLVYNIAHALHIV